MSVTIFRCMVAMVSIAILLSILSGLIPSESLLTDTRWNNDGRDCRIDVCKVAASGWPIGYIWDMEWTSPTNSADWMGVLLDMDYFSKFAFLKNTLAWLAPSLVGVIILRAFERAKNL